MKRSSVLLVAMLLGATFPVSAHAAQTVVLGFGASYVSATGESRVHHGIDVAGTAGDSVTAPQDGTVRFVGHVPAAGGGTCLAVTIDSAAGRMTLMPLEDAGVSAGESVAAGAQVGRLAASGDGSSDQTHLHLGLRHGDLYVDPAALLAGAPTAGSDVEPQPQPAAGGVPTTIRSTASAAPAVAVQMGEGVSLAPVNVGAAASAAQPSAAVQPGAPVHDAAQVTQLPQGVSAVPVTGAGIPAATTSPLTRLADAAALGTLRSIKRVRGAAPFTLAGLAVLAASSAFLLSRRAFERRFTTSTSVSHRWSMMLQQLRAGDTLRGLTSCSGESAFTVPGPFSPEEVTK